MFRIKTDMFKRKAYNELLEWKNNYAGRYACLLEGARRVGKTTIAEHFAQNEYKSYIKIDFSEATTAMLEIMRDITNLDLFFFETSGRDQCHPSREKIRNNLRRDSVVSTCASGN